MWRSWRTLSRSLSHMRSLTLSTDQTSHLTGSMEKIKGKFYLPQKQTNSSHLIILVGWSGSNHKVLQKYANIYTNIGLPTLAIIPSLPDAWFSTRGAKLTINILETISTQPINVLFQLFSSGSIVVLPTLQHYLSQYPNIDLKGIIFDSGPAEFSYKAGTEASKLMLKQGGFIYYPYLLAANLTGITIEALNGRQKRQELDLALQSRLLDGIPQLYLCSQIDTVVPIERVHKVISKQKEKERDVEIKIWENSEHVRHFMIYPDEYQDQVTRFLCKIDFLPNNI